MKTVDQLLEALMEQTYMLERVVKLGKMETILKILDERDDIIKALEMESASDKMAKIEAILPEYQRITDDCMRQIEALKVQTQADFSANRKQQNYVRLNKKAYSGYNQYASYNASGSKIDNKK